MGYGRGPYGVAPFGAPAAEPPSETSAPLVSSRALDATGGRGAIYVIDSDGAFAGMDDVAQRVLLLIANRAGPRPTVIDPRSLAARRDKIRAALSPLTQGQSPTITDLQITVERSSAGRVRERVEYRKTATDTKGSADPI